MKNYVKILIPLFILLISINLKPYDSSAELTITGCNGLFTVPAAEVPERGKVNISSGFIFTPGNFYLSSATSPIPDFELSVGKEIPVSKDYSFSSTPLIFGSKYLFYKKGTFKSGIGIQIELAGDKAGISGTPITLYGVISESAGKLGKLSTGLGYTFGMNAGYRINFFVGLKKPLVEDKLYLIGEFTNFSVRHGQALPWNEARGVFNGGLQLKLTDFLMFNFAAYDMFDNFLTIGISGELKLKVF